MPVTIVLPGMDGSAEQRKPFRMLLGDADVRVASYPPSIGTYASLCEHLAPTIPVDRPCLLIGESFGGPLAVLLAANHVAQLSGLCLCASFVRYPIRFGPLASLSSRVPVTAIPNAMISSLVFGRWGTAALRAGLVESLSKIEPAALAARIRAAASVDVSRELTKLRAPLLTLRATRDHLVPAAATRAIARLRPDAVLGELSGPHALLQTQPERCAEHIRAWTAGELLPISP